MFQLIRAHRKEKIFNVVQYLVILSIVTFGMFVVSTVRVSAMTVSPVLYDLSVDPGQIIEREIEIKNDSKVISSYELSSEDFISEGEEGGQRYLNDSSRKDLASWMSWNGVPIVIQPGASVRTVVKITIPNTATAGGHYATIFATKIQGDQIKDSVGFSEQIGVLFLVRVSGELTERASVNSFHLRAEKNRLNRLPVLFDLRIKNGGSTHVRPSGSIVITNAIGKVIQVLPINSSQGAILPNGIRHFEVRWGSVSLASNQDKRFWNEVKREWSGFAFGKYTAELRATYGDRAQPLERARISFWVIPWHLMIVGVGTIIVLIALANLYRHCLICSLVAKSDAKRKTTRRRSSE